MLATKVQKYSDKKRSKNIDEMEKKINTIIKQKYKLLAQHVIKSRLHGITGKSRTEYIKIKESPAI